MAVVTDKSNVKLGAQTDVSLAVPEGEATFQEVAEQMHRLLAMTYRVYNSTQMAHWNVEGLNFHSLHELFEDHYKNLSGAVDDIAERIRALGFFVNGGLGHMVEFAAPQPVIVTGSAERLVNDLLKQHEQMITEMRVILKTAQAAEDEATADLLVNRLIWHEEAAWMLRSTLGRRSSTIRPTPGFQEQTQS